MLRRWLILFALATAVSPVGAAQTAAPVAVTGVVLDQTGAVLPGASIDLVNGAGALVQSSQTDSAGAFRFDHVAGCWTVFSELERLRRLDGRRRGSRWFLPGLGTR
jgi:hypothetical protein